MLRRGILMSLVWSLLLPGMTCLSTGCASGDRSDAQLKGSMDRRLEALRSANFKGEVYMETGGTPIGVNISNVFSFGPQQMTLRANGHVDFSIPQQNGLRPVPAEVMAAFHRRLEALEND